MYIIPLQFYISICLLVDWVVDCVECVQHRNCLEIDSICIFFDRLCSLLFQLTHCWVVLALCPEGPPLIISCPPRTQTPCAWSGSVSFHLLNTSVHSFQIIFWLLFLAVLHWEKMKDNSGQLSWVSSVSAILCFCKYWLQETLSLLSFPGTLVPVCSSQSPIQNPRTHS